MNKTKFKKVSLDSGFLSWDDGEMEISACSVYDDFCKVQVEKSLSCFDKKKEHNFDDLEVEAQTKANKEADKLVNDYIKKYKSQRKKTQSPK